MPFTSITNARGIILTMAAEADSRQHDSHAFRYRGVYVLSALRPKLMTDGERLGSRPVFVVTITLPGAAEPRELTPERALYSHAEAAGYALGTVDALLRAAEHGPTEETEAQAYRRVQRRFHQLGRAAHGDEWDTVRAELVRAYTDGRYSSSRDLDASELMFFIGRWEMERELADAAGGDGASAPVRLAA